MYQSKVLDEYLKVNKPGTKESRDHSINEVINDIITTCKKTYHEEGSYNNKLIHGSEFLQIFSFLMAAFAVAFILILIGFSTNSELKSVFDLPKTLLTVVVGMSIVAVFSYWFSILSKKSYGRSRKTFESKIANLFQILSDTPYEIRVESESKQEKWVIKVVVESNTFLEGGHVIKEKTQHFTSYLNPLAEPATIISAVTDIVKKAESFK